MYCQMNEHTTPYFISFMSPIDCYLFDERAHWLASCLAGLPQFLELSLAGLPLLPGDLGLVYNRNRINRINERADERTNERRSEGIYLSVRLRAACVRGIICDCNWPHPPSRKAACEACAPSFQVVSWGTSTNGSSSPGPKICTMGAKPKHNQGTIGNGGTRALGLHLEQGQVRAWTRCRFSGARIGPRKAKCKQHERALSEQLTLTIYDNSQRTIVSLWCLRPP